MKPREIAVGIFAGCLFSFAVGADMATMARITGIEIHSMAWALTATFVGILGTVLGVAIARDTDE
jgi:hypothetical protein